MGAARLDLSITVSNGAVHVVILTPFSCGCEDMIEIHDISPAISFTSHAALQASNSDHRMNGYPPHFTSAFLTWVIAFEIFPLPPCLPISLRTDLCSVAQRGSSRRVASCCSYDLVAQVSGDVETIKQRICNSGEDAGYRGWEGVLNYWRCLVIHSSCVKETARLQSDSQCILHPVYSQCDSS